MKLRDRGKTYMEINEQITATDEPTEINLLIEKDNTLDKMNTALQQLNKEQQLCVTLFYLQKKSYQQVAAETGYNMMQVKSHIQNGKRNLKIQLERLQQNER